MSEVSRDAQLRVVRWAVDAALTEGPPENPPLGELGAAASEALQATGLSAYTAGLADEFRLRLPPGMGEWLDAARSEVDRTHARFRRLLPVVLDTLAAAGALAAPVRGLVLADQVWSRPAERSMVDLDLLVARVDRDRALAAMVAAGFSHYDKAWTTDAFVDARPASGTAPHAAGAAPLDDVIELHPAWVEHLHGYAIDDGGWFIELASPGVYLGARCRLLPPAALVVQCLGHLSASVIRRDVRGVNVLDVVLGLRALDEASKSDLGSLIERLDARFSAPGLWLVEQVRRGAAVYQGVDAASAVGRLPSRAREQLLGLDPAAVLRGPPAGAGREWRAAWPVTLAERVRMVGHQALRRGRRTAP